MMFLDQPRQILRGKEHWALGLVLLLGLILGLVYLYLMPPWQHYDEPSQFEYAWLIANRPGLPERGEYDQNMRREVAASMIEHDFYQNLDAHPNLLSIYKPIEIGISQTGDPPLYYWFAALPLRLVKYTDITFQLYVTRFVSLGFYLLTILAAYGVISELTSPGNPLRFILPLTLILIPGFSELMTAVNNDVGATAFFSLFLWAGVRLIRRGFNVKRFLALALFAAACFFTKNTVTIAVLLAVVPLLFSIFQAEKRRYAWYALLFMGIAISIAVFSWGDAAGWTRQTDLLEQSRDTTSSAPLGNHAIRFTLTPQKPYARTFQILSGNQVRQLWDQTVTLGAWMWSDQPGKINSPLIRVDGNTYSQQFEIDTKPHFYAFHATIAEDASQMQIFLAPHIPAEAGATTIYYDGIVLVEGNRPLDQIPDFDNQIATHGSWGEQPFMNLVHGGSGESPWPFVRPWADKLIARYFPGRPSEILGAVLDWRPVVWYYRITLQNLAFTFWARFGWGHVKLLGNRFVDPILLVLSLLSLLGAVVAVFRHRRRLPWPTITFFSLVLLLIWGPAVVRGVGSLTGRVFIPSARYAYPAIIPSALLLVYGWRELFCLAVNRLRITDRYGYALYAAFFVGLNALAIVSIVRFYS
ncbi:MAG: DUF2142 domain-containing protein [Anaerolineales bacterium]